MNNTKHTSGPWYHGAVNKELTVRDKNQNTIISGEAKDFETALANAKLISAAPDLLEAAIYALKSLPNYGVSSVREKLENAIKKATE